MTDITFFPPELESVIGAERRDFTLESGRSEPIMKPLSQIFFGTVWMFFLFFIVGNSFFSDQSFTNLQINSTNRQIVFMPLIFILVGIFIIGNGIYSLFKKGGIFVSTPTRLINYRSGKITVKDWEQFSGNSEISGKNITLEMRTGKIQKTKHSSYFVPDIVYLSQLDNVMEIEKICRQRIKENDSTPPGTTRAPEQGTDIPTFSLSSLFDFFKK